MSPYFAHKLCKIVIKIWSKIVQGLEIERGHKNEKGSRDMV